MWLPLSLALGAVAAAVVAALPARPGSDQVAGRAALFAYGSPVASLAVTLAVGPRWCSALAGRSGTCRCSSSRGPTRAHWGSSPSADCSSSSPRLSTTALSVAVSYAYEHLGGVAAAIGVHFAPNAFPAALG